jgi:putative addiction module component (TIGR02574 family)
VDQVLLEREAMLLPPGARALLADALLSSLDDETTREVEAAWVTEAERRLASYRRGEVSASDGPAVFEEFRRRLGS